MIRTAMLVFGISTAVGGPGAAATPTDNGGADRLRLVIEQLTEEAGGARISTAFLASALTRQLEGAGIVVDSTAVPSLYLNVSLLDDGNGFVFGARVELRDAPGSARDGLGDREVVIWRAAHLSTATREGARGAVRRTVEELVGEFLSYHGAAGRS